MAVILEKSFNREKAKKDLDRFIEHIYSNLSKTYVPMHPINVKLLPMEEFRKRDSFLCPCGVITVQQEKGIVPEEVKITVMSKGCI